MQRRDFLQIAAAQAALTVSATALKAQQVSADAPAQMGPAKPAFGFQDVLALAQERAASDYVHRKSALTGSFADLNYDQYRAIRFRRDADPWKDLAGFGLDLLPPGLIFYEPVAINLVQNGRAVPVPFSTDLLDFDRSQFPDGVDTATLGDMGWSGFRLRSPLNRPDVMDEFLVFQGASYFRAVAQGTLYGLSARGLAINTGSPDGEEFPLFTDFWLHRPAPGAQTLRIHAILDTKSLAGAYQFDVTPGGRTLIATRMALFPRREVKGAGIAPLTSMFWFGPGMRAGVDDYRPAVHDSNGLQMLTGTGQHLWRALTAHQKLQISGFLDENPKGFGLAQRPRDFADYQDAEARYDRRPSAWIAPRTDWGKGQVKLVEIPVENEFNDNIVSFWTPETPLHPGKRYDFSYDLSFAPLPPVETTLAQVIQTRSGRPVNDKDGRSYIVDFPLDLFRFGLPNPVVTASAGRIENVHMLQMPEQNLLRLAFLFRPNGAAVADLQAVLNGPAGAPLSETWMLRWSK